MNLIMIRLSRLTNWVIAACLLPIILGCATESKKQLITPSVAFRVNNPIDEKVGELFYKKALLGKFVIWTDAKFADSSNMSIDDLITYRDIKISNQSNQIKTAIKAAKSTKFEIYIPEGEYMFEINLGSKYEILQKMSVKSGEAKIIYWKNPESQLIWTKDIPSEFSYIRHLSYITEDQLFDKFSTRLTVETNVSKDEKKVEFSVLIKDINKLEKFTLNNSPVNYAQNDIFILINDLNYGNNKFEFLAKNEFGFESRHTFTYYRKTDAEKKKILDDAAAEKKRLAEAERMEKIKAETESKAEKLRFETEEKARKIQAAIDEKNRKIQAENEARNRKTLEQEAAKAKKIEQERVARDGDGSSEDKLCQKYGFKPQANGYAECRMKLDQAKRESEAAQAKYEREKAAYDQRVAEIEKERERARSLKQLELGLRMLSGQSPMDAMNTVGTGAPFGPPPIAAPTHQTITLPNGRMVNCSTFGTNTSCF